MNNEGFKVRVFDMKNGLVEIENVKIYLLRSKMSGLEFGSKGTGECGGLWKIVKWNLCGGILEISMEGIATVFC